MSEELYLEFFGLTEAPFLLAPDPGFLYLSTQHSLAQAYLNYALLNRDSFVVITGETGAGKTILINKLLTEIGEHVSAAHVFQTQVSTVQFLQSVLLEFGFKPFDKRKVELLDTLNRYLLGQRECGRQVVLIVDDAHNLSEKVLEEIRLISEVSDKGGMLNVILCGQPTLVDKLESPELEQLAQRVRFRFHVRALSVAETQEYVLHRLAAAGCDDREVFAAEAHPLIYRYTGGIPRLINILCDTALTGAFADDLRVVNGAVIDAAVAELDWVPYADRKARSSASADDTATHGVLEPGVTRAAARGRLVLELEGRELGEFEVPASDRLMIGRDVDNEIRVPAEFVSRHHAQVTWADGACWLTDLNSTNGTFVNSQRIKKRMLQDGDVIQLGRHTLTYVHEGAASQDAPEADTLDGWRETTVLPLDAERSEEV